MVVLNRYLNPQTSEEEEGLEAGIELREFVKREPNSHYQEMYNTKVFPSACVLVSCV